MSISEKGNYMDKSEEKLTVKNNNDDALFHFKYMYN